MGRYDLPEPTRTVAPPNSLLAQEASGVTYNWDTDTLFVVGDGSTSVVQVSKTGALIDSMSLALGSSPQGTELYDTEGLTYVGGGQFVLVEERYRQASLFTYVAGTTLQRTDVDTVKLGTTIGNVGLEGLCWDSFTSDFFFVKEKDPISIFQTSIDFNSGTASNGSPTATSSVDLFDPALAGVLDFSDVFLLSNVPSLVGTPDFQDLLIISQESGQIVQVDRAGNEYGRLTIVADPGSPLSVPDMTMEGVTMDHDGILYVVNENGGGDSQHPQLWVYAPSTGENQAPTAVTLLDQVASIPENTSMAAAVKVADISITDDGLGSNLLILTGPDASSFEAIGVQLFLRAGTVLNAATKPSYSVTVNVDDLAVGSSPDASVSFTLTVTASTGGTPSIIISEVAPWASGNSPLGADWFEVTNIGTAAANISGWKVDDNSSSFGSAIALNGITSIAPGESVIFVESTSSSIAATFKALWFGASAPASLQVGSYSGSGIGLSTGGDAVNLYDSSGALQANVVFGTSPSGPYPTFDNAAGLNNTTISTLSAAGIHGAFIAANSPQEIGSPGTLGAAATTLVTVVATDAAASEVGSDPGTFRISRTGSTIGPLTVNYTLATGAGQADGADYTPALSGVATILSGQAFVDLTITPVDDSLSEGMETIILTLGDTGSYDVGSPGSATITIADSGGGGIASLIFSEVAPWASGNSPLAADWFEVTNVGTAAANISGWKVDDSSSSFAAAIALTGITSIAPGESVIFIESTSATIGATFKALWFGASPPAGLQVGSYSGSGIGLGTGGDALNLYNAAGALQANVVFGSSPTGPYRTFDNAAGLNNTTISTLSVVGVHGAFVAANSPQEIGSPGTITTVVPPTPVVTVVATDANASEVGSDSGTFRFSRTGDTASELTVYYMLEVGAGQADSADYTPELIGVATIAAGQTSADLTITPIEDGLAEGAETIVLTLAVGSYDVGSPASATITIADSGIVSTPVPALPPLALALCMLGMMLLGSAVLARRQQV